MYDMTTYMSIVYVGAGNDATDHASALIINSPILLASPATS